MIGQIILNYKIEKLIGEGGMGNVYLGIHTHIGRQVAIKALNPNLAKNPELKERFKNEASTLSQLHHPNIVALYDYVETEQGIFLVMEYAPGKTLDEYIKEVTGPIPEDKAIPIFNQILEGVAYAHQRNVIHRDIKPSNIIITNDGKAKILDFGIAKIISESNPKLTKTGTKLGTVLYMSPEQVKGIELDKKTDIYSLGITLFQAITGKCPYDDQSSEYEVYKNIVENPLPEAKSFYIGISEKMDYILKKATAKAPEQRYENCESFKIDLNSKHPISIGKDTTKANPAAATPTVSTVENKKKVKSTFYKKYKGATIFWNIFFGLLFIGAFIGTGFQLMYQDEEMYVLANNLALRSTKTQSSNKNKIGTLTYGEKVFIIAKDEQADSYGNYWVEVNTQQQKKGFVVLGYLGSQSDVNNLRLIFSATALYETPVKFKKAVLRYFVSNGFISNQKQSHLQIKANTNAEFINYGFCDFDGDGRTDYACIACDSDKTEYTLLVFLDTEDNEPNLVYQFNSSEVLQMNILKKGSQLFTGKYTEEIKIDWMGNLYPEKVKVYESLKKNVIYIKEKNSNTYFYLNYHSTRKEMTKTLTIP